MHPTQVHPVLCATRGQTVWLTLPVFLSHGTIVCLTSIENGRKARETRHLFLRSPLDIILFPMCVCMHSSGSPQVWKAGCQYQVSPVTPLHHTFWDRISLWTRSSPFQLNWLDRGTPRILLSLSAPQNLGLQMFAAILGFYVGDGYPKGPHNCATGIFPAEPSPRSQVYLLPMSLGSLSFGGHLRH